LALQVEGLLLSLLKRRIGIYAKIYGPVLPALWRERYRLLRLRRHVRAAQRISFAAFQATMQWSLRKAQMVLRHGLPEVRQTRG
jgi:hypothetical protein